MTGTNRCIGPALGGTEFPQTAETQVAPVDPFPVPTQDASPPPLNETGFLHLVEHPAEHSE